MAWFVLLHSARSSSTCSPPRGAPTAKDLGILVLRQRLRVLQRQRPRPPRLSRWEKLTLAVLTARLARLSAGPRARLDQVLLLVRPETVLRWHRELVRRTWTMRRRRTGGRPATPAEVEALILRLAREDPAWGYCRIQGELGRLGHPLGHVTVRAVLRRHGLPPAPQRRRRSSTWRAFLRRHQGAILACDFFTVETLRLRTIYGLFFSELGTRRVDVAGCPAHPTAAWVTQQGRHVSWQLQDGEVTAGYLIHDRDSKFPPAFDAVFRSEGIEVVRTPYRAPRANAVAERWVRSVRQECLEHLLIVSERHLRRVLTAYARHYNHARPHQGLGQRTPVPLNPCDQGGTVQRRDVLGGLIHEYCREAA